MVLVYAGRHRHRYRIMTVAGLFAGGAAVSTIPQAMSAELPTTEPVHTTHMALNKRGYTGTIPTQFGLLTRVKSFSIAHNTLTGTVPTELGLMSNIQQGFELQGNR